MWLIVLLWGCGSDIEDALSGTVDERVLESTVIEEDWLSCSIDDECVYVDLDCCGCSSGGTSLAINADHTDDFAAENPMDCEDIGCIALYTCSELGPRCVLGRCRG